MIIHQRLSFTDLWGFCSAREHQKYKQNKKSLNRAAAIKMFGRKQCYTKQKALYSPYKKIKGKKILFETLINGMSECITFFVVENNVTTRKPTR